MGFNFHYYIKSLTFITRQSMTSWKNITSSQDFISLLYVLYTMYCWFQIFAYTTYHNYSCFLAGSVNQNYTSNKCHFPFNLEKRKMKNLNKTFSKKHVFKSWNEVVIENKIFMTSKLDWKIKPLPYMVSFNFLTRIMNLHEEIVPNISILNILNVS